MIEVSDERFEELVDEGLALIPDALLDKVENLQIVIGEQDPRSPTIMGLYEGVPLTERTSEFSMHLPDRVTIYRRSLQNYCDTEEELVHQVKITVVHEIAHYFGIEDDRLHELGWG